MKNKTIEIFKQICKIPRESGNEQEISNFIVNFAKNRRLEYVQDAFGNVIVKKFTGANSPVILQAHLDMVCETNLKDFDFSKNEISIFEEDGFLKAKGTTLGADNGIGVAEMLAALDSDLKINVECVFTVSEETNMSGAENIDVSGLTGKIMVNLDGFNEKTIINEVAAFSDIEIKFEYEKEQVENKYFQIKLSGLEGGHSGFDIDKGHGNAIKLLAELLLEVRDIQILNFVGGGKFNVIPSCATCDFYSELDELQIKQILQKFTKKYKKIYKNLKITTKFFKKEDVFYSISSSIQFLNSILEIPDGVINRNEDGLVTSSSNLGNVNLSEGFLWIGARSSKIDEETQIYKNLKEIVAKYDYSFNVLGYQPGFETPKNSTLIKKLTRAFQNVFGECSPMIKPVHICVEAGMLKEKMPDTQVVIISPEILGAHSVNEKVKISSIIEFDNWLFEFLKILD